VRCYWQTRDDAAVATVTARLVAADESGEPSCVWHEVHAWALENIRPPRCVICGERGRGVIDLRDGRKAHNLCNEREKRRMVTPPLVESNPCPCSRCRREVG